LLCVSIQDPSQRAWPDEQEGFPGVFVVTGFFVVTEAPGIPEVTAVTGTAIVCTGVGDTCGWDVSVHPETRISAKKKPTMRIGDIL
jgi:hypothetical protein